MATRGPEDLRLDGAQLRWWPQFLPPPVAAESFDLLSAGLDWRQRTIRLFGRSIPEPRLTAWHGDPDAHYSYSGRDNAPQPWTAELARLRDLVSQAAGAGFNSVLGNLYRDGADHLGWHSDDEPELGPQPVIASLSLGEVRRMQFRLRPRGPVALTLDLPPGGLLVMAGQTQRRYQHRVPATRRVVGARINLTFRLVGAGSVAG